MKKYLQIFAVLIVFTLLVIAKQGLSGGEQKPIVTPREQVLSTPNPTMSQSRYKDGTYTGSVVDAYYGFVQVQTIISGGKISDVKFLQHPSDNKTSQSINNQAMPYLIQEAIQAQTANVNTVSGASATSQAFKDSLRSALIQAI